MASSLGNLNMSDMKWIGEPLDVVGQYQKGVNLAEQGQRMKQSAEMHPLKMEDTKARTNLVKQQGEYNLRTMDSRVGLSDSMARLQETAANIAKNTQVAVEDRTRALSRQEVVNADYAEGVVGNKILGDNALHQRNVTNQEINLLTKDAQVKKFKAVTSLLKSQAHVAGQTQDNQITMSQEQANAAVRRGEQDAKVWEDYKSQEWQTTREIALIDSLSLDQLQNYQIPHDVSNLNRQAEITRHLGQKRSGKAFQDHATTVANTNLVQQQEFTKQLAKRNKLNAKTGKILDLTDAYGNPLFTKSADNKELNQRGEAMSDRLVASAAVLDGPVKLSPENYEKIRHAIHGNRGLAKPHMLNQGETLAGQYGADYNGQLVLDEDGIAYAKQLLAGQSRAAKVSEVAHAATIGLRVSEMKDGVMTFENGAVMDNAKRMEISKLIQARRKEWIAGAGLDENGNPKTIPDSVGRDIAVKATMDMGLAGMTVAGSFNDARAAGLQPGSPFIDPRTGKISIIPKTTGAGGTTGDGATGDGGTAGTYTQALGPNDPNDVMMGRKGYSTVEKMGIAAHNASDQWPHRADLFNHLNRRLGSGDFLNDSDARFITKLVIDDEWKTGHGVGAAFKWAFQDDPDASEDSVRSIMGHVRTHTNEKIREARDDLKIAVFGEDFLTVDQGRVITNDQLVRLTSAVKKHPNDTSKWPLLENTRPGIGVKRGKENYSYSPSNAHAIRKEAAKWRTWTAFSGRIKLYKENKK